jgi:hypothetical protein
MQKGVLPSESVALVALFILVYVRVDMHSQSFLVTRKKGFGTE